MLHRSRQIPLPVLRIALVSAIPVDLAPAQISVDLEVVLGSIGPAIRRALLGRAELVLFDRDSLFAFPGFALLGVFEESDFFDGFFGWCLGRCVGEFRGVAVRVLFDQLLGGGRPVGFFIGIFGCHYRS